MNANENLKKFIIQVCLWYFNW